MSIAGTYRISADAVHVWRGDLDDAYSPGLMDCLTPADEMAAAAVCVALHRRRFRTSRALLKTVLAHYLHRDPAHVEVTHGTQGKPLLADAPDLHFNVSHSGHQWCLAITTSGPIGIDIEPQEAHDDLQAAAYRILCREEREAIFAQPLQERSTALLRCWTRKEALLKAVGLGFAIDPALFNVGWESAAVEVAAQRALFRVQSIEIEPSEHLAIATTSDVSHVQFRSCAELLDHNRRSDDLLIAHG